MESSGKILGRDFYRRDTAEVARNLLGKVLVREKGGNDSGYSKVSGIITETEAYYGTDDPASHAHRGLTPRSSIMFGAPGFSYVYLCYGMYWLLNVVTEEEGRPGAVLIRAVKPNEGLEVMRQRRKTSNKDDDIAGGPGKLTMAMDIKKEDNGIDMTSKTGGLYITGNSCDGKNISIISTRRIGIKRGQERMLRFLLD
ncbi:MAG: DNA-3-methyladenine glycosylase [Actinobacteria bacterium]|nr:DNA-3-methyladenine glycosylase [Actinomycetota bacterium]